MTSAGSPDESSRTRLALVLLPVVTLGSHREDMVLSLGLTRNAQLPIHGHVEPEVTEVLSWPAAGLRAARESSPAKVLEEPETWHPLCSLRTAGPIVSNLSPVKWESLDSLPKPTATNSL